MAATPESIAFTGAPNAAEIALQHSSTLVRWIAVLHDESPHWLWLLTLPVLMFPRTPGVIWVDSNECPRSEWHRHITRTLASKR